MSSTEEEHISFFKKIKHLGKILNIKEKVILYSAVTVLLLIFGGLAMKYYLSVTKTIPANGGEYIEGININSAGTPKTSIPSSRPLVQLTKLFRLWFFHHYLPTTIMDN